MNNQLSCIASPLSTSLVLASSSSGQSVPAGDSWPRSTDGCTYISPSATVGPMTFTLSKGEPACSTNTSLSAPDCTDSRTGACQGSMTCNYIDQVGGGSFKGEGDFVAAGSTLSGTMVANVVTNRPNQTTASSTYNFSATVM
jgi:hypothetical protein